MIATGPPVLLVNPPYIGKIYTIKAAVQVQLPLGLAYLAAALERAGIPVEVLDANAEMLDAEQTAARILASPARLVGFTATTNLMTTVATLARAVKAASDKTVVLGGPHVTFLPEPTLAEHPQVDIAVLGEGEETLVELAHAAGSPLAEIAGIAFRDGEGRVVVNRRRPLIADLDALPRPARHLFPLHRYQPGALLNTGVSGGQAATIITSRGCPGRCKYCSSMHFWGSRVRFRSAPNIVDEVEQLVRGGVEQLAILDDTFFAHRRRVVEFCELLLARAVRLRWWCYGRLQRRYDRALLRLLRRAGCYALNFGVESGNQGILDRAGKRTRVERIRENVQLALDEGFFVFATFIIGLPGETRATALQTMRFAEQLNPHVAQFCIATPFPGTDFYEEARAAGWLDEVHSWDDIGLHVRTRYRNDDLSADEIYELYRLANRRFFLRPAYLLRLAKRFLRHPREVKGFALAGIYMLAEQLLPAG